MGDVNVSTGHLTATVKARVEQDHAVALSKIALKLDRSVSDVVRIAIREYLARQGRKA
jgi:predicted transcriptional regulator